MFIGLVSAGGFLSGGFLSGWFLRAMSLVPCSRRRFSGHRVLPQQDRALAGAKGQHH
jgi:hypothetical protein